MTPDDWTTQMRLRGIPASHHRMGLDTGPERKWPIGWMLIGVAIFSAAVWAAIIIH